MKIFLLKVILSVMVIILTGCITKENRQIINTEKGFMLQKFEIKNKDLQDTINNLTYIVNNRTDKYKDYILTLELRQYKSNIEFWFDFINKENAAYKINTYNLRVVGYITDNSEDVILLSNINNRFDFEFIIYKFIQPTDRTKRFDFIYFDDTQYQVDKEGRGLPPLGIRDNYTIYIFQNNELIKKDDDFNWYLERLEN